MSGAASESALRRFLGRQLRARWRTMAVAFGSLGGAIAMDLAAPWPVKIVVDHVLLAKPLPDGLAFLAPLLAAGPTATLVAMAGAIAGIALLSGAFAYLQTFLSARVGHELVYALRRELFDHLQRLSLAFHRRNRSGELMTKVASDTTILRDALSDWAVKAIAEVLLLAGVLTIMFVLEWRLALVVTATLPILFGLLAYLNRKIRLSAREQRRTEGRIVSRLNDVLSSIALVQAFGREDYERARFEIDSAQSLEAGIVSSRTSAAVSKAVGAVSALGLAGTVLAGGLLAVDGAITPGELLIFVAYVNSLYKPVRDLGKLWAKFSRARVSAERIGELLDREPEIRDAPDAIAATRLDGEIVFDRVSFAYDGGAPVLRDVSFRLRPGEHVALIGPSGSGKSTLVNLLLRLYEPQSGAVRIDGRAVQAYTRESLRSRIGIVLQDTVLAGATVRENIGYGRPGATDVEIETAARQASAHGFIETLPNGYDAVVGERGCVLSGGQRQRICLARTLIKQPDILVLDEATSAVDAFTAAAIQQAVGSLHAGRTTLVIGHKFPSFAAFDRVLELRDGAILDVTGAARAATARPSDRSDP